ncbi:unnamed protein product [Caenorhabditis auriculariae]|uniref:Uncharacterized protein n=1 Tax=Caenorhabditis auriculariae TaxID=2777116 RepID=A0A8S1H9J3_9PELO|nr:unnamed protein product [Caenorhabditis auriculariae]
MISVTVLLFAMLIASANFAMCRKKRPELARTKTSQKKREPTNKEIRAAIRAGLPSGDPAENINLPFSPSCKKEVEIRTRPPPSIRRSVQDSTDQLSENKGTPGPSKSEAFQKSDTIEKSERSHRTLKPSKPRSEYMPSPDADPVNEQKSRGKEDEFTARSLKTKPFGREDESLKSRQGVY